MPDSTAELPPLIRRQEVVAIALVGLLLIAVVTVLYFARAFFLPVVMAFVVGTMLSPVASFLERYRIPRSVGAVLIVIAVAALGSFIVGLMAAPAMEWSSRLPELAAQMKDKLHIFDRPLALWHELQTMLGGNADALPGLQMPKFEWVQPTLEFLSPTFTEFLLFFATLLLFIASWTDLRRALIMNFGDRVSRLRTLRILNEIEVHLGELSADGDDDQCRRRYRHRHCLRHRRHAQPGRPRRAGRDAEFHPDHRSGRRCLRSCSWSAWSRSRP